MQSRVKRAVTRGQLEDLLRDRAGISCRVQEELKDGWFNTAYRVLLDGDRSAVVKVAPSPDAPVLRYERGIMASEALFYHCVEELNDVPVPELLHEGTDFLVVSMLDGTPWNKAAKLFTPQDRSALLRELGRIVARVHGLSIGEDYFGCPAPEAEISGPDWRTAFTAMVEAILEDAQRWASPLGIAPAEVRALVASGADSLDEVRKPSLIHFDLWPGNVFVSSGSESGDALPQVTGLIDHERVFWGDPVAELVSLELCGDIGPDSDLMTGYVEAGGQLAFSSSLRHRLALYRVYFGLILVVECGPRAYGADHLSWCRSKLDTWVADLRAL